MSRGIAGTIWLAVFIFVVRGASFAAENCYPWLDNYDPESSIVSRIPPPQGLVRSTVEQGSFSDWLRHLPLKEGRPPVLLHSGHQKRNQDVHVAVVDIDVGKRDLQQCADAVIRLRAEFLFAGARHDAIHFNFTSGHRAGFAKWAQGFRPQVNGSQVRWVRTAAPAHDYPAFRRYLDTVFMYAGTLSLSRELVPVPEPADMRIGDVFIQGGSPGHAVIVVDLATQPQSNRTVFLLAQSYMPAQDVHVLRNPRNALLSPWYDLDPDSDLVTPQWRFSNKDLKRFPEPDSSQ
jgi:Domain of unknown function (4846)